MTVKLSGTLNCRTLAEAEAVKKALPEHLRLTRAEEGCISFDVTPSDSPLIWNVSEEFTGKAAYEAHQQRAADSPWAEITKGIPRDYKITGLS